jgi:hypothetical protein
MPGRHGAVPSRVPWLTASHASPSATLVGLEHVPEGWP